MNGRIRDWRMENGELEIERIQTRLKFALFQIRIIEKKQLFPIHSNIFSWPKVAKRVA